MQPTVKIATKLLIVFFMGWAIYVSVSALFGITIYFPFKISESEIIPYHRWQSVRIAVFLTFAYFIAIHLIDKEKKYLPVLFLRST